MSLSTSQESILTPYKQFWPGQKDFLHIKDPTVTLDVALYQGGFGSGKTWIGSLLGIILAHKYPGIVGLVLAKTYPMVRDTTMATYFDHLKAFEMTRGIHYDFNKSESRIDFKNGSQILFRHLQDPEKIKSLNAGFVEVEEASQITKADFDMTLSRLRQVGIPRKRWFGHTNPEATKGWVHKIFVEQNTGIVAFGDEKLHIRRIISPTTDNKALSEIYVESLRHQYDPEYYKIYVLGQDGDYTRGLVSYSFSELNVRNTEYKRDLTLYLSCDFNVDPMSWVLAHRYNGEYHFFDEIVVEGSNIDESVREVIRRYPDHLGGIVITGDASGNNRDVCTPDVGGTSYTQMLNTFNQMRYPGKIRVDVRSANPLIADRVAAWNAMVCNADGVRRVVIDPRCKWLIYNLQNLKYKEGTGIIDKPTTHQISKDRSLKFLTHIFDAASYLVERYDPVTLRPSDKTKGKVIVPDALTNYLKGR